MPRPPDDDAIGDVHSLFRDDPPPRESAPKPRPTPAAAGGYDLIGGDADSEPEADDPVPPVPVPVPIPSPTPARPAAARPKPGPRPRADPDDESPASEFDVDPDPAGAAATARVDRVWSRWAEWGPTLRNLAIAGAIWLAALYIAFGAAGLGTTFLIFVIGLAGLIVLAYPILITLERPVRMTPEQAVRDYFNALAHYRPHYRRMWLLLSSTGQDSREYRDFAGFQAYWKRTLARLRAGRAGGLSTLTVQVQDFRAEKSAGKSAIRAKFTVRIHLEKSPGAVPANASVLMSREQLDALSRGAQLASYRMAIGLVRGPDNMWYLNDGALPTAEDA